MKKWRKADPEKVELWWIKQTLKYFGWHSKKLNTFIEDQNTNLLSMNYLKWLLVKLWKM